MDNNTQCIYCIWNHNEWCLDINKYQYSRENLTSKYKIWQASAHNNAPAKNTLKKLSFINFFSDTLQHDLITLLQDGQNLYDPNEKEE